VRRLYGIGEMELVKARNCPKVDRTGTTIKEVVDMARLVQKIILPEMVLELEVGVAPLSWSRQWPTHVRIEGEIPPETLKKLIEYVEQTGVWKWVPEERKFYPIA